MTRRTVLVPLVALLLGAPLAAVVPTAAAAPPPDSQGCSDARPGSTPKGCPTAPEPPSQPADGTGTCLDVIGGEGAHDVIATVGSLTRLDLTVGTGLCTGATYTFRLHALSGALLAEQTRTLGLDPAVRFAVELPGHLEDCVQGQVVVEQDGVVQDLAPDGGLQELCETGTPAQNWR